MCPFTGKEATIWKNFTFSLQCFGPVRAILEYRFPILISEEANASLQKEELDKVPGFHIIRFNTKEAVIYIKDRPYYEAFIAANEREVK